MLRRSLLLLVLAAAVLVVARPSLGVPAGASHRIFTYAPGGFRLEIPAEMTADLSIAPAFVRLSLPGLDLKVSRDRSPYDDVEQYLVDYPNRFLERDDYAGYRELNHLQVTPSWTKVAGYRTRVLQVVRTPAPGSPETQNQYELVYILTGGKEFYTLYFRAESLAQEQPVIDQVVSSFTRIPAVGEPRFAVNLRPVLPDWNAETRAYYSKFRSAAKPVWGIFTPWALTQDYSPVAKMEQELGYNFPILLHYLHLGDAFPTQGMVEAYKRGQVVELTMQVADYMNDSRPRANAALAMLDGQFDQAIHEFARSARDFGHPFLFRFDNEMNTDWTQYSGVMTMNDPDIFVKNWRHIYDIFQQEGVKNAIWIFNPNEGAYPPMHWNNQVAYYPGNEYVQVLGLTGYNTGNGLQAATGEHWRSFREIYDAMAAEYRPLYRQFPWMITEFASSSRGGDKAGWIHDMFRDLPRYPEIKAAVWWSYGDPDYRPGHENEWARPYFLDERPEYLAAFKSGLRGQ